MSKIMNVQTDFGDVAEFIGQGQALASELDSTFYIDEVLRRAHGLAAKSFDRQTAAVAVATQSLNHMYEWGTAGINPAPGTPRISPTSAGAKLWKHKLTGGNSANKGIDFEFKPSVVPVPLPTARTAGIRGLKNYPTRRHTFAARPWISEYGVTLHIKPKYSSVLFIPLRGEPMTSDTRAIKNNYIITSHAVTVQPGKTLKGNFRTHWEGWWSTEGYDQMRLTAKETVDSDMRTVIRASGKRTAGRKYTGGSRTKAFNLQVTTARAKASAEFKARVSGRRTEDALMEATE